jgi:hypothetical protein
MRQPQRLAGLAGAIWFGRRHRRYRQHIAAGKLTELTGPLGFD